MKVHFGGSGKGSVDLYHSYILIRDTIRDLGHSIARDWLEDLTVKRTTSDTLRYEETLKAINKSDVVILESTYDTSSIGKQLDIALSANAPVLILNRIGAKDNSSIDKFVTSSAAKLIKQHSYNEENIKEVLQNFLDWAEDKTNIVRFNLEIERELDNYLKNKAKENHTSKSEEIRKLILNEMNKN